MIKGFEIKSLGSISELKATELGSINLLIGKNGSGKTFALKTLYVVRRCIEKFRRGKDPRAMKDILAECLYWTFQPESLGSLVKKGEGPLSVKVDSGEDGTFSFSYGERTENTVKDVECTYKPTDVNSLFIPAKEVISLQDSILRLFDDHKMFGFDMTHVDLARAITKTTQGRNYPEFSDARGILKDVLGGKLTYDINKKTWVFLDNNKKVIEINLTSEGIKRLSILESLLGSHYLTNSSIIFIDEAEANLHPEMIARFMEIILLMAQAGVQFFISTHSYFVIKNLYILAQKQGISIPTLSFETDGVKQYNLRDGMPTNPIIQESVNLYRQEVEL